jgi:hypothetical protein
MSRSTVQSSETPEQLTFTQAAHLTGKPKVYLRELAESGRLAVHLVPGAGDTKLRVSHASLVAEGLVSQPSPEPEPVRSELSELIALVREQTARITTLEEQRFQLGAQLGAALERVVALEEQMVSLPRGDAEAERVESVETNPATVNSNGEHDPSIRSIGAAAWSPMRDAVVRLSELGVRRPIELGARILPRRLRLFSQSEDRPSPR